MLYYSYFGHHDAGAGPHVSISAGKVWWENRRLLDGCRVNVTARFTYLEFLSISIETQATVRRLGWWRHHGYLVYRSNASSNWHFASLLSGRRLILSSVVAFCAPKINFINLNGVVFNYAKNFLFRIFFRATPVPVGCAMFGVGGMYWSN